jgi:hypothetical protein
MNKPSPKLIDGKAEMLAFARAHHPRAEHTPVDLAKVLPQFGFEVLDADDEELIMRGPDGLAARVRTMTRLGGDVRVKHLTLVKTLEWLMRVGTPTWESELRQFDWHVAQLAQCDPFQVPAVEEFGTRQELTAHIDTCKTCEPTARLLGQALELGSNRSEDKHLRELIERSHENQADAIRFYEGIAASQRLPAMAALVGEKPARSKKEAVPA